MIIVSLKQKMAEGGKTKRELVVERSESIVDLYKKLSSIYSDEKATNACLWAEKCSGTTYEGIDFVLVKETVAEGTSFQKPRKQQEETGAVFSEDEVLPL